MTILIPMAIDEIHQEACDRANASYNSEMDLREAAARQRADEQHDSHVTNWRIAVWEAIEQLAWLRRQEAND